MLRRRFLSGVFVTLVSATCAHAQTHHLAEGDLPKSCYKVQMEMHLTGKVRVQQEGKTITLEQNAQAKHVFLERLLEGKEIANKAARHYESAEASIVVDTDTLKRTLREERSLMVAERRRGCTVSYSPKGLLTQEEMELTEHLDTLAIPGLLPGREVAVGDTWRIENNTVQGVCDLDALLDHNLTGKLSKVEGDVAHGQVSGIIKGIDLGAQVTMEIQATFEFDLKEKRITKLGWKQSDERVQGPVSPALSAEVIYTIARSPILEPNELNDIALVPVLSASAEKMTPLQYRDPKGRFEFQPGREWHLVGEQENHLVYRLLSERGDFLAQVTLTPFKKESADSMMSVDEFAILMSKAPGWEQEEKVLEKNDSVNVPNGNKAYRVGAAGKLDGVSVVQYFHLLQGPRGDQLIVTFTMRPEQVEEMNSRDLVLVRTVTFVE